LSVVHLIDKLQGSVGSRYRYLGYLDGRNILNVNVQYISVILSSYFGYLAPIKSRMDTLWYWHRRLADGDVHCAASATYQIFFRLPIPKPNPIPNPKP